MAATITTGTRDKRFHLRATLSEQSLIRVAAEQQGMPATEFILRSACEKAEQALAGQTRFVLDDQRWTEFLLLLDRPPVEKPRLRQLFAEHHVAIRRS